MLAVVKVFDVIGQHMSGIFGIHQNKIFMKGHWKCIPKCAGFMLQICQKCNATINVVPANINTITVIIIT